MSAINPYDTPQSTVADAGSDEFGDVGLFALGSRIGRVRYLGYSMAISLMVWVVFTVFGLVTALTQSQTAAAVLGILIFLLAIPISIFGIILMVRRIHDFDNSGWLALLMFVPVANFILGLLLLVLPGTEGRNRFGAKPPPNTTGVVVLASLVPVSIIFSGILAAIAIPAYNQYIQTAKAQQQQNQPYQPAPSFQR